METETINHTNRPIHRDQIIISLGVSTYWISIVEEYECNIKELALVHYVQNTDWNQVQCVPLNKWFDSSLMDCELSIPLHRTVVPDAADKYHLLERNATEAQLLWLLLNEHPNMFT